MGPRRGLRAGFHLGEPGHRSRPRYSSDGMGSVHQAISRERWEELPRKGGGCRGLQKQASSNSKSVARLELFAQQHRSCLTESEVRLWSALNAGQLGVCFRRQVPVGARFIADFCAPSIKLIV